MKLVKTHQKGGEGVNLKALAFKLQAALIQRGRIVRINQRQVWLPDTGRMVTKYILREESETLLESYRIVDVVKCLAEELGDTS